MLYNFTIIGPVYPSSIKPVDVISWLTFNPDLETISPAYSCGIWTWTPVFIINVYFGLISTEIGVLISYPASVKYVFDNGNAFSSNLILNVII